MYRATAALALALLAGCMPRPAWRPGEDLSVRPEKMMFVALSEVKASDDQRLKVMAAWDDSAPQLKSLIGQSNDVLQSWRGLDRRDAAFRATADALAARWGELWRARMAVTSRFESRVARVLDADQWRKWQDWWQQAARRRGGPEEWEGGRGRRGDEY